MGKNYGRLVLGGLVLLVLLRKGTSTSGGVGGGLRLQLLDDKGMVVAGQGGASMSALTWNPFGSIGGTTYPGTNPVEGRSYTLRAIITNLSTKNGLPVNVTFQVSHNVMVGTANRLSKTQETTFAVGPVATFLPANVDGTFQLQIGDAGQGGVATVVVRTLDGKEVARASDTFAVVTPPSPISYKATVSLTPIAGAEDYLAQIAAATLRAELDQIYTAVQAAAGRGEISTTQLVLIVDAINTKIYGGTLMGNRGRGFAEVLVGGRH